MSCNFTCNENFGDCSCLTECHGICQYCMTGCYDCNDVYSWCNIFTSGGSCQAGDGYTCEGFK